MTMRFGSLFSGIGGMDLGLERAGMECAWQCEIDEKAAGILARHWPGVTNHKDVKNVRRDTAAAVDLVCGGFPCQDLSVAGKRAGLAGSRSGLWLEFARIIDELEPSWVVIENVPGLLSSNRGRDFFVIIRWLVERGYGVCWRVLDAQYFGLAQRRRRVFIVASFGSGRCAKVLFERAGVPGDTPPRREAGKGATYDVAPSLAASGRGTERAGNSRGQDPVIVGTLDSASCAAKRGCNANETSFIVPDVSPALRGEGHDASEDGQGQRALIPSRKIAQTLTGQSSKGFGGGVTDRSTPNLVISVEEIMTGVRRLTPVECERLQGFPDGWTERQSDSVRYKQLGNAVAVPVAEWIGKQIMLAEGGAWNPPTGTA